MLMVFQVINQLTETLIPYLNKQWALRPQDTPKGIIEPDIELTNEVKKLKCPLLESDHHLVKQVRTMKYVPFYLVNPLWFGEILGSIQDDFSANEELIIVLLLVTFYGSWDLRIKPIQIRMQIRKTHFN